MNALVSKKQNDARNALYQTMALSGYFEDISYGFSS